MSYTLPLLSLYSAFSPLPPKKMSREEPVIVPHKYEYRPRTWRMKFADAFLGLRQSIYNQNSYIVHFVIAAIVLLLALGFQLDLIRWCLLLLCIVLVLAGEMFNTAIEMLAKAITTDYNPHIERALNIASGAVLLLSFGAALIGSLIFLQALFV